MANLPQNFQQVANSFSYTVLNFRMPWENAHANSLSQQQLSTGFPSTPVGISVDGSFGPPGPSQYFDLSSASPPTGEPTSPPRRAKDRLGRCPGEQFGQRIWRRSRIGDMLPASQHLAAATGVSQLCKPVFSDPQKLPLSKAWNETPSLAHAECSSAV